MASVSRSMRPGFGWVASAGPGGQTNTRPSNGIELRGIAVEFDLNAARVAFPVRLRNVQVVIPEAAVRELVSAATNRAGLKATGSLGDGQVELAVSVSLLRVRVAFGATVDAGRLILTPRGGLPGWLLGQAANVVSRTEGLTMYRDGRIAVDAAPLLPDGISLERGFTGVRVTPESIVATLG